MVNLMEKKKIDKYELKLKPILQHLMQNSEDEYSESLHPDTISIIR